MQRGGGRVTSIEKYRQAGKIGKGTVFLAEEEELDNCVSGKEDTVLYTLICIVNVKTTI